MFECRRRSAEQSSFRDCCQLGQGMPLGSQQLAQAIGCYIVGNTVAPRAVLVAPSQGTLGNEGTGSFYGKPYRNWDFSVSKNWKFKGAVWPSVPRGVL